MTADELAQLIQSQILCTHLEVEGPDQVHFSAVVVSAEFEGLSRVRRQQAVYAALGQRIQSGEVHALSLKAYTPEEFQTVR
jgi:acid stress-induced BolA-like protein IbaG/YrbA